MIKVILSPQQVKTCEHLPTVHSARIEVDFKHLSYLCFVGVLGINVEMGGRKDRFVCDEEV